jgi:hypothetical protein
LVFYINIYSYVIEISNQSIFVVLVKHLLLCFIIARNTSRKRSKEIVSSLSSCCNTREMSSKIFYVTLLCKLLLSLLSGKVRLVNDCPRSWGWILVVFCKQSMWIMIYNYVRSYYNKWTFICGHCATFNESVKKSNVECSMITAYKTNRNMIRNSTLNNMGINFNFSSNRC